jgi:hypothetical protein
LEDSNDKFIKEKFAFLKKGITLPELKEHLGEPVKVDTTTDWLTIYKFQFVNCETDYSVTTDVISNSVLISNVRIVASINGEPQKPIMWP